MSYRTCLRRKLISVIGIASLLAVIDTTFAADLDTYRNPNAPLEQRVDDLLGRLTLTERIALMSGSGTFTTAAIERLGIPALHFSDGPNGVRSNRGDPTTTFPTGVTMAATWDPALIREVGTAIGREARAMNVQVMLGPNVNIQRGPLAGRNFEAYSEDPYLSGRLGIGFVTGVQSQGVGTAVKHFVGNEQETDRQRSSSSIDERTLHEIYLKPFEMIIKEAKPWTVMAAYNRLNGTHMSENHRLLTDVLKKQWGFDGLVMSDWFGAQTTVSAARSGLDLEMPGPPRYFGPLLERAVQNYLVERCDVDAAARSMLKLIIRSGVMDGKPQNAYTANMSSDADRQVARRVAEEAITLLKNDKQLVPLDRNKIKSLALIGPNADVNIIQGGGSAHVLPSASATPLEALQALLGNDVKLSYAQGVDNEPLTPAADPRRLSPTAARMIHGLNLSYFANAQFSGKPVLTTVDGNFDKFGFGDGLAPGAKQFSARWTGYFWPQIDGEYELALAHGGEATLYIDGKPVITNGTRKEPSGKSDFAALQSYRLAHLTLKAARHYAVRIDYVSNPLRLDVLKFGVRAPAGTIEQAVAAARNADAAIVFVGASTSSEGEGEDRANLELYGKQNELIEAVLAANPNTIVVLNNGAPLALPWLDKADTLIEAWLPGQEGNRAVADVLFGNVNPSGKLPVSFPKRLEDNPTYTNFIGGPNANYGEGVFVGYRYYDKKNTEPMFPFGYGLSYTQFEYDNLRLSCGDRADDPITVTVDVRNSGQIAGTETVQLYAGDLIEHTDVLRPIRELKGFERVTLAPNETRTVTFKLTTRDLAYYDVSEAAWRTLAGKHQIAVGGSSRDLRIRIEFEVSEALLVRD